MPLNVTINHIFSLSPALEAVIMALLDDIKTDLANLDASVKTKSDAVAARLSDLASQIATLTAQVASGTVTPDEIAGIKADIANIAGHVDAIPADAAPAPPAA